MNLNTFDPLFSRSVLFDTDDASGGGSAEKKEPEKKDPEKKSDEPENSGDDAEKVTLSKKEMQDKIDAVVKDRLEREKRKAEKDREKEKEDADNARLVEQKKFEELSQKQSEKIVEYEKQLAELALVKETADRYEKALKAELDAQKKGLPAHILALLDKLDVADQLEYIAANAETLKVKSKGVPETPNPADKNDLSADDKQRAGEASDRFYRSRF